MRSLFAVFQKELADQLGSRRFFIFLLMVGFGGLLASYMATQAIRSGMLQSPSQSFVFLQMFLLSEGVLPPFTSFVSFFAPMLGLILTFDAINREKTSGTLSRLLSQPITRDAVINGKFLAALVTIAVMLLSILILVIGLGLRILGVPPSFEEVLRIIAYFGVTLIYIGFWMSLAMLFSILSRRVATSALAVIAIWIFFAFFMTIISGAIADRVAPLKDDVRTNTEEEVLRNVRTQDMIGRISPLQLYNEASTTVLHPGVRTLGPVSYSQVAELIPSPLSLRQSLVLVWPHITSLIAMTLVSFAISYVVFMRQEIRSL
ncbi:MAG: ABC transporter permease [Chloroflexi bacterium]|nr:ABC transporter permease [Chloroflexota bacterium]